MWSNKCENTWVLTCDMDELLDIDANSLVNKDIPSNVIIYGSSIISFLSFNIMIRFIFIYPSH